MSFNLLRWSIVTGALLMHAMPNAQQQVVDESLKVEFNAQPAKCIALRQGRQCYAAVTLSFKLGEVSDYCIYEQPVASPLRCWHNTNQSNLRIEFESSTKTAYLLVNTLTKKVVSVTQVDVGWVHKTTSRKRRWRLF